MVGGSHQSLAKMSNAVKTRLVKPKTKKGERVLKEREPQLVSERKSS